MDGFQVTLHIECKCAKVSLNTFGAQSQSIRHFIFIGITKRGDTTTITFRQLSLATTTFYSCKIRSR